jgi:hypothetical protein
MTRRISYVLPCALLASLAMSGSAVAQSAGGTPNLTSTPVLKDRDNVIWDMAFLPDGAMFFTERCGGLSVRLQSGTVIPLLGIKDSKGYPQTASDLFCSGQAGMAGVAIDPDFASNRFIYVYSASSMTAPGSNRVMRLTVSPDLTSVKERQDIVTDIAYKPAKSDHPFGDPGAHNGGRLRFGPADGFLYVTTGDTHNGEVPQSPTRIGGKVLRIDRDGKAAPGNNPPQGLSILGSSPTGTAIRRVSASGPAAISPSRPENGPWQSDEVTALEAGGNAGWDPARTVAGRGDCPDGYCGYSPNQMGAMDPKERAAFMPMTDTKTYPDAMKPAWNNDGLSQGMMGCAFLNGAQWKDWNGRMVVPSRASASTVRRRVTASTCSTSRPTVRPPPAPRYRSPCQRAASVLLYRPPTAACTCRPTRAKPIS